MHSSPGRCNAAFTSLGTGTHRPGPGQSGTAVTALMNGGTSLTDVFIRNNGCHRGLERTPLYLIRSAAGYSFSFWQHWLTSFLTPHVTASYTKITTTYTVGEWMLCGLTLQFLSIWTFTFVSGVFIHFRHSVHIHVWKKFKNTVAHSIWWFWCTWGGYNTVLMDMHSIMMQARWEMGKAACVISFLRKFVGLSWDKTWLNTTLLNFNVRPIIDLVFWGTIIIKEDLQFIIAVLHSGLIDVDKVVGDEPCSSNCVKLMHYQHIHCLNLLCVNLLCIT
jgi:hypothetical protein